jgi:hypothetical protein
MIDQKQIREDNYNRLVEYLKINSIRVNNDLFKTILYAINSVTIYNKTIPAAFKLSIDKYNLDYDQFATLKSVLYRMFNSDSTFKDIQERE